MHKLATAATQHILRLTHQGAAPDSGVKSAVYCCRRWTRCRRSGRRLVSTWCRTSPVGCSSWLLPYWEWLTKGQHRTVGWSLLSTVAGAGQDVVGVDAHQFRRDVVQVQWNVHHQDRGRGFAVARRPHRDDAEHVVQSLQEAVRGPHQQVGGTAAHHPGLSVRLSVCLSVCLSVSLFVCLSVCPSVCLSVCPSVCLTASSSSLEAQLDGWPSSGGYTISVCNKPARSTQPCIPSGSLNRVPASAGVRAGMSALPGVIPCGMWVPVAVWQFCELLYACYLQSIRLTFSGWCRRRMCWMSGWHVSDSGSTWSRSSARRTSTANCQSRVSDIRRWTDCGARLWRTPRTHHRLGLERGADLHMAQLMPLPLTVSCFSKIQIGFTFLALAHPGSPEKGR